MKILALSDVESKFYYDYYTPGKLDEFGLILACGDLRKDYLEFFATLAHCPVVYVRGNHDDRLLDDPPGGCVDADGQLVTVKGLRILGLGGSMRYRDGKNMYTEREMARRVQKLRRALKKAGGFDLLLTHAPARGLNDFDSDAHRGFECFNALLEEYRPRWFVHGHIHSSYGAFVPQRTEHHGTTVLNACEYVIFDLPDP